MDNFTASDFSLTDPYLSPGSDFGPHDFSLPLEIISVNGLDPDTRLVGLQDLDREGEDPMFTQTSRTIQQVLLPVDNAQARQEFWPDAFELPDFELESQAEHSDTPELRPEDFELPDIDASVDNSDFSPEDFELPDPELPIEHTHAPELRPEDFELPVIEAPVDNMEVDAFGPNDFELPDLSEPANRTLPPFCPTILSELRSLSAEYPSIGRGRGAESQKMESLLQVRRNVGNAGLRLLALESYLVKQHFRTVEMIQTIDRSLASLSHTLVRRIPAYDDNYPPSMP